MAVSKSTFDTVSNIINNINAGSFTASNINSLYESGRDASGQTVQASVTEIAATMQAFTNLGASAANTVLAAVQAAENSPFTNTTPASQRVLSQIATQLGKANLAIAGAGAVIDAVKMGTDFVNGQPVKLSDSLSLLSNASSFMATAAILATAAGIVTI